MNMDHQMYMKQNPNHLRDKKSPHKYVPNTTYMKKNTHSPSNSTIVENDSLLRQKTYSTTHNDIKMHGGRVSDSYHIISNDQMNYLQNKKNNSLKCNRGCEKSDGTCFEPKHAQIIIQHHNEHKPNNKVNTLAEVRKVMNCPDDKCVIDKAIEWAAAPGARSRYSAAELSWIGLLDTLPKGPAPKTVDGRNNEWLNNFNINDTMSALHGTDLYYYGTQPIDFQEIDAYPGRILPSKILSRPRICWECMELKEIANAIPEMSRELMSDKHNWLRYSWNYDDMAGVYESPGLTAPHRAAPPNTPTKPPPRCFGLGLNLDTHRQPGSHWVCVFVDCRTLPYQIIYYDSAGRIPPKRVRRYMHRLIHDLAPIANDELNAMKTANKNVPDNLPNPPIKILYNNIIHQQENNECGMYVISVLERLSKDRIPFDVLRFERRRDISLNELRFDKFVAN